MATIEVLLVGAIAKEPEMAYIFVDDGYPDADEYENNFIWFDEDDPQDRSRALKEARRQQSGNPSDS